MAGKLQGQVAIVTGGGRGIGLAIALALSAEGASVVVSARSVAELDETVALVRSQGGSALAVAADVTDERAVAELVSRTEEHFGPVTLLVNNAGSIGPLGPLWEVDAAAWKTCMEVNVLGPLYGARAVLPGMVRRGHGRIVNVATGAAVRPMYYASAYTASKTALVRLSESLAYETRDTGIAVFALTPGLVRTSMPEFIATSEAGKKWLPRFAGGALDSAIPAERPAELVVTLASGAADGLSGRLISVNDDVDALIARTHEIRDNDLYTLRINALPR